MSNLAIKLGDKKITISVPETQISIVVDNESPAAVPAPILDWKVIDGDSVNYESAEELVAELGPGWRIPTRIEAESILDLTRFDPAVDTSKFPGIKSKAYWTSTPYAANKSAVWVVDFNYGHVDSTYRNSSAGVLAVRSSQ